MCLHCQSIKVCAFRNIATEQEHVQVQLEENIFPREAASLATSEKPLYFVQVAVPYATEIYDTGLAMGTTITGLSKRRTATICCLQRAPEGHLEAVRNLRDDCRLQ